MYQEVLPDIFLIPVPLPNTPLRELNAYLVRGVERSLLIDNGFNAPVCATAIMQALKSLEVDTERLDFFLTHLHSDHTGLTGTLAKAPTAKILCSAEDGRRINAFWSDPEQWSRRLRDMHAHGFPDEALEKMEWRHPGKMFGVQHPLHITPVSEGDVLLYGGHALTVISVPGHTPGHMSLWDEDSRCYFAGDHVLGTITPNIVFWDGVKDSLGDYLDSIDKIAALPVERIFPGHRALVENPQERLQSLKRHHDSRLAETLGTLDKYTPLHSYTVASSLRWNFKSTWNDFPVQQKWFATGETVAHLHHLEVTGRARCVRDGEFTAFLAC